MSEDLFEIVTHLVCSAPTSLAETPSLAAFRLVDAAHRLMRLAELADDEFLRQAAAEFGEHATLVMTDQPAFDAWLAEYARGFTREALRRARAAEAGAPG